MKRITAILLAAVMFMICFLPARCFAWGLKISTDIPDGEYLTDNLGMDKVTRQRVIRTIEENWTSGLRYAEATYSIDHQDYASCVNIGSRQYEGREQKGYGYNCTGFVASVLYYANGGTRENALTEMKEIYKPLQKRSGSFTNGTGWYSYIASGQNQSEGSAQIPKTRVYYLGEITDPDSIQTALTTAEKTGRLKEGYIMYFWPSTGWDCHLGIYAGRDSDGVHRMYHAAGRGNHNGVRLTEHVALSQAASEGASYLYIIPLPEAKTGWQVIDRKRYHFYADGEMTYRWYKEDNNWYYLDPDTGEMAVGLRTIDGKQYFFYKDGRMARYIMFGKLIFDRNGICVDLRRYNN